MSDEIDTWRQLAQEVERGGLRLRLDPERLGRAKAQIKSFLDGLEDLNEAVLLVSVVSGFGDSRIGQELADKFAAKGGGAESIRQRLKALAEEAQAIQTTIEKASAAVQTGDQALANRVATAGDGAK